MLADAGLLTPNGTFFAELIAFIVMILILGKYAYPRIIKAATEREDKIEAGLRAAQESEERLAKVQGQVEQTLEEARTQAREILNRAHQEATGDAAEVLAKSRVDAESLIVRARTEIEGERDRGQHGRLRQRARAGIGDRCQDAPAAHRRRVDEGRR